MYIGGEFYENNKYRPYILIGRFTTNDFIKHILIVRKFQILYHSVFRAASKYFYRMPSLMLEFGSMFKLRIWTSHLFLPNNHHT